MVGPGAAGRALARASSDAGWPLLGFVGREEDAAVRAASAVGGAALGPYTRPDGRWTRAGIVLLTVRDAQVASVARALVGWGDWRQRVVLHVSGALTSAELAPLHDAGAAVGSWHPLMTFPSGDGAAVAGLPGDTVFGLEGEPTAVDRAAELTSALGCRSVRLRADQKALWHAAAVLAGNLTTAVLGAGALVLRRAGIGDAGESWLHPLARESVAAAARVGAVEALTGPVARGDVATVERHVAALASLGHDPAVVRCRELHAAGSLVLLQWVRDRLDPDVAQRLERVLEAEASDGTLEA